MELSDNFDSPFDMQLELKRLKRILLIDDDDATNFLNKVIISKTNVTEEIIPFQKAVNALEYIQKSDNVPEIIFLDINMPLMDGWEFMKVYEKLPENKKGSIIIMLTSSINPDDKKKSIDYKHISGFETKPLSFETVEKIVAKYFSS